MIPIVENLSNGNAEARRKRAREALNGASLRSACGGRVVVGLRARAILKPQLDLMLILEEAGGMMRSQGPGRQRGAAPPASTAPSRSSD
jgi:hypothetical protein